jgi:hypothetical protein
LPGREERWSWLFAQDFIEILVQRSPHRYTNRLSKQRAAIMGSAVPATDKRGRREANEYRLIDPDDKSVYLSAQGYTDNVVARPNRVSFGGKVVEKTKIQRQIPL